MGRGFAVRVLMAAGLVCVAAPAAAETTIIHAGRLLAVPGEGAKLRQSVVVEDGKIREIRAGFASPFDIGKPDAQLINLSDSFVLPGLIDSHVHLTGELGPQSRLNAVTESDPDIALDGAYFALKTLKAGFTTVRDVGADGGDAIFALRDAIAAGRIPGPRILAAGHAITPTGGHADMHGYREDVLDIFAHELLTCDGADDCRRAVRLAVKRGADQIKITATGGVLSDTAAGTEQQFFMDELNAIVETAHSLGREVTAHAHGTKGINAALAAGVDSIEHSTMIDDESIRLYKSGGAYMIPTVLAGVTVADMARNTDILTPAQRVKALRIGDLMIGNLRRAREAGIKIAFGTDSGVSHHGDNAREFALMVEAGFTPEGAIRSATVAGADHLGLSNQIGRIAPGLEADIVAVKGNPLTDVSALMNVSFVMKDGTIYKNE